MTKTITTRLSDDFVANLKEISEKENVDISTVIRKLLNNAISEWKTKKALEELREHKISIGKAAQIAEISKWDMIELAGKNNIDWIGYTKEDLKKSLKT